MIFQLTIYFVFEKSTIIFMFCERFRQSNFEQLNIKNKKTEYTQWFNDCELGVRFSDESN